ncbi:MAG TPA: trans-aconitate 2-methyltransferase [Pseudonocardiaceae bacterium]|jgi:trans-aconitate 2-methyltransferase|nr:trans-aconitate 2-methyltransferase [Pseudonocardiaceae bacterium]
MWDPETYLAFSDQRARPFHDLLARVRAHQPRRVVDLGCGPGTLTPLLARRWPGTQLEALDSSPEMVAAARERGVPAELGDVCTWSPGPAVDVVVCNAVLQWVPGHEVLLRRWLAALPADAWLAVQIPGNLAAPSHAEVRLLAAEPRWRHRLELREPDAVLEPAGYAALLASRDAEVDVWETTYLHRLRGQDPVLDWISGTALRPVRAALSEQDWVAFRAELASRLRAAYPAGADGVTWFPFRRIFAVAQVG